MPGTKKKDNLSTILKAAMSLFAEKGFSKVTMSDIAKASGRTVEELSSLYPTKEELLIAAFRVGHMKMERRLRMIINGSLEAHITEMFDATLDGLMPFGPEVHLSIILQATKDKTMAEILRRTSRNVNFAIKAYLVQMVSLSIIDEVNEVEKVNQEMVTSLIEGVAGTLEGKKLPAIKKTWVANVQELLTPSSKTTIPRME